MKVPFRGKSDKNTIMRSELGKILKFTRKTLAKE